MDIDTDYFTTDNALNHKVLGLAHITPEGFVNTLKKKNISSKLITISYSVEGGYTPLRYRYLAEFLLLLLQDIPIDRELLRLNDQAVASLAKGRYKKAISVYKKALSLNPDNPSLYYGLSLCCEGLDMDEKSNIYFKKAVELDSFYNDALLYRASTSMINGSFIEAGELFERFSAINPESPYAGYINLQLGIIEEKKGDLKAAIGYYEKAKGFDSTLRATYNNLGNCYSKLKMYKEAILEYEGALEIDSTVSGIHYNLANCYVKIGLYSIAIKHYQEALRIEPTLKDAINNLKYVQDMLKNQN